MECRLTAVEHDLDGERWRSAVGGWQFLELAVQEPSVAGGAHPAVQLFLGSCRSPRRCLRRTRAWRMACRRASRRTWSRSARRRALCDRPFVPDGSRPHRASRTREVAEVGDGADVRGWVARGARREGKGERLRVRAGGQGQHALRQVVVFVVIIVLVCCIGGTCGARLHAGARHAQQLALRPRVRRLVRFDHQLAQAQRHETLTVTVLQASRRLAQFANRERGVNAPCAAARAASARSSSRTLRSPAGAGPTAGDVDRHRPPSRRASRAGSKPPRARREQA